MFRSIQEKFQSVSSVFQRQLFRTTFALPKISSPNTSAFSTIKKMALEGEHHAESYTGGLVATNAVPGTITIYDVPPKVQGQPLYQLPGAAFTDTSFNANGSLFATWVNPKISLFKMTSGEPLGQPITIEKGKNIERVHPNTDGSLVAVSYSTLVNGINRHGIRIFKNDDPSPYDLANEYGDIYFSPSSWVSSFAFNPNSTLLVSGHCNLAYVYFWDLGSLSKNKANKPSERVNLRDGGHGGGYACSLVFDSSGNKLACGNMNAGLHNTIQWPGSAGYLFELNNVQNPIPLKLPDYWTNTCIAFSADNQSLVTGGRHRNPDNSIYAAVHLWDTHGIWKNKKQLDDVNSPFFGRRNSCISFVGLSDAGSRVISIDGLTSQGDNVIRSCNVDGTNGSKIDQHPKILAFAYPNQQTKKKQEVKLSLDSKDGQSNFLKPTQPR